jgi:hypothetical protein
MSAWEDAMTALIGTATCAPTLLEDFMQVELEVIGACRTAIPALAGPDERALVVALRDEHEGYLRQLKRLTLRFRAETPEDGTINEARTIGRIKLAKRRGGDGAILEALDLALDSTVAAYGRGLRNAALPETMRPILTQALDSLEKHRRTMRKAARLAA